MKGGYRKKIFWIVTFFTLVLTQAVFSQNGNIQGTVFSKQDQTPIWGASVYILGTIHSAISEEDGSFVMPDVPAGVYTVTTEDFTTGDSAMVANVNVVANETINITVNIGISVKMGEVIEITYDQPKSESIEAAIEEVKEETKVTTIVSSEEFKSKGDSKVTDAAKRASGITIEGGKYVYIRGLSDRYSKTLLDGVEIPGLDPNRNAVQLDMFPTSFVQSLKIIKTFSPDLPGDFTGGLVDIRTKDFPEKFELSVNVGAQYNDQASLNKDFLSSTKSKTDWLGFDNEQRQLPKELNRAILDDSFADPGKALVDDKEAQKMEGVMDALNSEMVPTRKTSATPYSAGFTVGNTFEINKKGDSLGIESKRKVSVLGGLNYRNSISYYNNAQANVYDLAGSLTEKNELNPQRLMTTEASSEEVLIGAIAKLGFEFNKNHKVFVGYLKNQSGKASASISEGKNIDDGFFYRSQKIAYVERSMNNIIGSGNHILTDSFPLHIDWTVAYTLSAQDEPDLRFFNDNKDENGNSEFREQNYTGPVRYWRSMNETNQDVKVNLMYPFELKGEKELKLKAGVSYLHKDRTFTEKRLDYANGTDAMYDGNIEDYLSDNNTGWLSNETGKLNGIGVYAVNQSNPKNNYNGLSTITAGYGMFEWPITIKLNAVAGARVEQTDIALQSQKEGVEGTTLIKINTLPSVNLSYTILDAKKTTSKKDSNKTFVRDMIVRLSYNQTLARPNFRELAPFAVEDFVNNSLVVGNPNLKLTEVKNYDVRWEYYPNTGEQISVAGFYKDFTNPIEQITSPTAANIEYTWVNNTAGQLYGVEIELRKNLGFISQGLKNFSLSGNLTLVKSEADINTQELIQIQGNDPEHLPTRPLFGQSPYIVNGSIAYKNDSIGLQSNLTLNVFGERLVLVTKGGLPDIYEVPRPSLDLNISKNMGSHFKLTLRLSNILNPEYKMIYKVKTESADYLINSDNENFVYNNYKVGRTFSFSATYNF